MTQSGEVIIPATDLAEEMRFFESLGFRLDRIFPSDDPTVAVMSGHGLSLRLDRKANVAAPGIHLPAGTPAEVKSLTSPSGSQVEYTFESNELIIPKAVPKFEVRRLLESDPWVIGRAGMQYRDLIPDRLGGSIIASHIRIQDGGPVPDMVHYHTVGFQLIYCYKGWVKVVYEDQGPPITLGPGDCVTQPPEIRHRVLESSDNLEVIEIGVPAVHMTTVDHDMELPTAEYKPDRVFKGQTFCHHVAAEATWSPWRLDGFEYRETGIKTASGDVASVQVARPTPGCSRIKTQHDCEILFSFVLAGSLKLEVNSESLRLEARDAFVIPPDLNYALSECSDDLEILEVALPGTFGTKVS